MNLGELRELTKDLNDDIELLELDGDHNYRKANVILATAVATRAGRKTFFEEDFTNMGEDLLPGQEIVPIICVNGD